MAFWKWRRRPNHPDDHPNPGHPNIDILDHPIFHDDDIVEPSAFDPEEYQRALAQGVVRSAYARVMFVGPGGVGKSSLLHGLMNKPLPKANSTQLAETITVKPATKKWASAGEDSKSFWREITDNDEIMELVGLVLLVAKVSAGQSDSSRFVSQEVAALNIFSTRLDTVEITSNQQKASADMLSIQQKIINDILTQIVEIAKKNPNAQAPEKEVLLLLWDCGGQLVFLDILPAFLTPRTMFFLFYDARRIAGSCIIRSFHNGKMIDFQEQRATTVEMLLEWMASIHAMLVPINHEEVEESVPKFPRIIPIGTHGDDLNVNKEEVIHQLNAECKGKAFIPFLKKSVIVDNTTAGQGENEDPAFRSIRKEVYDFACKDLVVETPVAWVLFRKVFQKVTKESNSPIVSYRTVEEIAAACNIPSTAVSTMVRFYHDLAVFFHYNEVPSLQDYVIANPQWLIDQFARIMAPKGFAKLWKAPQFLDDEVWKGHELEWAQLWESGILVQSLYEDVWKDCELPPQSLIDLLVHFLLAAPIYKTSRITNLRCKEYFISSVLPTFKSSDHRLEKVVVKQTAPLHLIFNTFYVPPGFFCRLVTTLLNTSCFQIDFSRGVYRDHIVMLCGERNLEIDKIILEKHKCSIQVQIIRIRDRYQRDEPFSIICHEVLNIINDCFPTIRHWLKGIEINYAFICEHCQECEQLGKQHFIRVSLNSTNVFFNELRCDKQQFAQLTTSHKYWMPICEHVHVGTPDLELTKIELRSIGAAVQRMGRLNDLVETLEMSCTRSILANDPDPACTVLFAWLREMTMRKYPNIRFHLAHHLATIGMHDVSCRLRMSAMPIQQGEQWGGWQDGSRCGTAIGAPQQSQVPQHTDRFATQSQFTRPEQPQQHQHQSFSGPPQCPQQQHFFGIQPSQQPRQSQQQFNQAQQQINGTQQQFKPLIGTHRPQEHLTIAEQRHFAGAQLQQPFTAVQQQPQEQFVGAQLSFGTLQPHEQFNVAQQPQQLFTGNQQQFGTVQMPQQQFRTYTQSQQQHHPILPALQQPHQQHPANRGVFNPLSIPSSSQEGGIGGISFQQPSLNRRDPQISTRNPFASNNPADGGAFHSDRVSFPDQRHSFIEGGISQQPQYSTGNPLSTSQASHSVQAGWETFPQEDQSARWSSLEGRPSQQQQNSSQNPFTGHEQSVSQSFMDPAGVSQLEQAFLRNSFTSDSNHNPTGDLSWTGWETFEEEQKNSASRHKGVPQNISQQNLFSSDSNSNPTGDHNRSGWVTFEEEQVASRHTRDPWNSSQRNPFSESDFEPQTFQDISKIISATSSWKLQNVHKVLNGDGVVIAILDTGINTSHETFKKKLVEDLNQQKSIIGFNFVDDKKDTFSEPELHGNMAAFVAAGNEFTARQREITSRLFASGVAPNAKLIICRVGTPYKWKYIIKALEKLIKIKKDWIKEKEKPIGEQNPREWGVDVISMSFGDTDDTLTGEIQGKMKKLIDELSFLGVILVAAAGNYGNNKPALFPANHQNVLSVGALNEYNRPAEMNPSCNVDVYAPGVNIATPLVHVHDGVELRSGTSCAAPAIAGLIALKIQFERNKHKLVVCRDDYHAQEILVGEQIHFTDMKKMFADMQNVTIPNVLDPYTYFKINCCLNIK